MFDVSKMTDEELQLAREEISTEMMKREAAEQEKMWKETVNAIYNYCQRFGSIDIYDRSGDALYLDFDDFDFTSIGEINAKY